MAERPARPDSRRPVRVTAAPRRLSFLPLLAVVFFNASGGPYGIEDAVSVFGPGLTLLLLALTPVLVALPIALAMAEMGGALPEEGGYVTWVRRVFGPFWSFQVGWWSWVNSFVDVAVYPALFADYLRFWRPEMTALERWLIALAFIWLLTAVNLAGIRVTGWGAVALAVGPLRCPGARALERPRCRHCGHDVELLRLGHAQHGAGGDATGGDGISPGAVVGAALDRSREHRACGGGALGNRRLAALADGLLARRRRGDRGTGPRARRGDGRGARFGRAFPLPRAYELPSSLCPRARRPAPALADTDPGAHRRALGRRARFERGVQRLRSGLVQGPDRAECVAVLPHAPPRAGGLRRPPSPGTAAGAALARRGGSPRPVDHGAIAVGGSRLGHGNGGLEEHRGRRDRGAHRPRALALADPRRRTSLAPGFL